MTDFLTPAELERLTKKTRLDTADIAALFEVKRRTVTDKWTKRPDFPKPVQRVSQKVVRWDAADVIRWATGERR